MSGCDMSFLEGFLGGVGLSHSESELWKTECRGGQEPPPLAMAVLWHLCRHLPLQKRRGTQGCGPSRFSLGTASRNGHCRGSSVPEDCLGANKTNSNQFL